MYHSIIKTLTTLQLTDSKNIFAKQIELFAIRIGQIEKQIVNINFSLNKIIKFSLKCMVKTVYKKRWRGGGNCPLLPNPIQKGFLFLGVGTMGGEEISKGEEEVKIYHYQKVTNRAGI